MAAINKLVRFAQTFGSIKKAIITNDKMILSKPGLPKSVPLVFIPVIMRLRSATMLHGKKQSAMTTNAVKIPVTCEYFNLIYINVIK